MHKPSHKDAVGKVIRRSFLVLQLVGASFALKAQSQPESSFVKETKSEIQKIRNQAHLLETSDATTQTALDWHEVMKSSDQSKNLEGDDSLDNLKYIPIEIPAIPEYDFQHKEVKDFTIQDFKDYHKFSYLTGYRNPEIDSLLEKFQYMPWYIVKFANEEEYVRDFKNDSYDENGKLDSYAQVLLKRYNKSEDKFEEAIQEHYKDEIKKLGEYKDKIDPNDYEFDSFNPDYPLSNSHENRLKELQTVLGIDNINQFRFDHFINTVKQEYFDYLDSEGYRKVADTMWGAKAQEYINKQKEVIQNVKIKDFYHMSFFEKQQYWKNLEKGTIAYYDVSEKTIYLGEASPDPKTLRVLFHEASHRTDAGVIPDDLIITETYQPNDTVIDGEFKTYFMQQRTSLNPKYTREQILEFSNLAPEFAKWNEAFPRDSLGKIEYERDPTEIRARINTVRQQMNKDHFDFIHASEQAIMEYIQNLPKKGEDWEDHLLPLKSLEAKKIVEFIKTYAANDGEISGNIG